MAVLLERSIHEENQATPTESHPHLSLFILHFKMHPHVHTSISWRHESCEMRHPSRCFSTCVCMYVCVKAAVAVLPYVGFTVSHFNDTHSSTQAAIVHPSVQPGNMEKEIQMWAQLTHLKNVNKSGGLEYQQPQ